MAEDRTKFAGGSDIAGILGISPWKKPVDVWLDKVEPQEDVDTKVKKRGRRIENYILDFAVEEYGLQIVQRNLRVYDPEVRHFAAQIDAVTPHAHVEAKSVHPLKSYEWGEVDTDELPVVYVAQAQWGMGCSHQKIETTYVIALIGDDLRQYIVPRDELAIRAMRERADEFWQKYVIPRVRPPMDYDAHAVEVIRRLYPGTNGKVLAATDDLERWRLMMQEAQSMAKHYDDVAKGAKAHLLDYMGEAALLTFSDGKSLRRKLTDKKGYAVEATEYMDARFVRTPA